MQHMYYMRLIAGLCAGLALALASAAGAEGEIPRTPSSPGAEVYIVSPADGAEVSSPVRVVFGLRGMGVAPAGVDYPATGHHHLIIDAELPDLGRPLPADYHHRHFGKGQTEVDLELPPGQHTLQLLLADRNHVPHEPPLISKRITLNVVEP